MIEVLKYLDELYPKPKCELNYSKDYELLIAVVLSAQTTDKKVNLVTSKLFSKYKSLQEIANADLDDLKEIIRPIGTFNKKAEYIKKISWDLIEKHDGILPQSHKELEQLQGVGHKTANVVLSNIYDIPAFAVDTHVSRVSKRLGFVNSSDNVKTIEEKMKKIIPKEKWSRAHHQFVLFGRYYCKAIKPECESCKLKNICKKNS